MKYQILSTSRTGSHYLYRYIVETNKRLGEYFLDNNIESGLTWLENEKNVGNHHPIIVNNPGIKKYDAVFIDRLINYYSECHILTINRNPWDKFKSWYYQVITNWEVPHRKITIDPIKLPNDFKIILNKKLIDSFLCEDKKNKQIINYILEEQVHTILQYEDLNESYLNKFFGVNTPHCNIEPMNIDYEKYIKNVSYWKKYFENKLNER